MVKSLIDNLRIVDILINIVFTVVASKTFLSMFFKFKNNKYKFTGFVGLFALVQIYIGLLSHNFSINLLLSLLLLMLFATVMFEGNLYTKTGFAFIYIILTALMEFVVFYFFEFVQVDILSKRFIGSVASKLLTVILIFSFRHLNNNSDIELYSKEYSWIVLFFPMLSLGIIIIFFSNNLTNSIKMDLKISIVLATVLLIFNIVILKLYQLLINKIETDAKNLRYIQQYEIRKEHNVELENVVSDLRKTIHDTRNHYRTINSYINSDKISKASEYISEILNEPNKINKFVNTGNTAIDAVITAKQIKIDERNISFSTDISVLETIYVMSTDLSILINNLLDNSIEANEFVEKDSRFIKLFIKREKTYLLISCVNPHNNTIVINKNGLPKTNKEDVTSHGFGLVSIKDICNKYNGEVLIEHNENVFITKCTLFFEK